MGTRKRLRRGSNSDVDAERRPVVIASTSEAEGLTEPLLITSVEQLRERLGPWPSLESYLRDTGGAGVWLVPHPDEKPEPSFACKGCGVDLKGDAVYCSYGCAQRGL